MTVPLLSAKEAARYLGVHVNSLKRWTKRGQLTVYRYGDRGDMRFNQEDLDAWLAAKRIEARDD